MTNGPLRFVRWVICCVLLSIGSASADTRVDPGPSPDSETSSLAQTLRSQLNKQQPNASAIDVRITVGVAAFREALSAPDKTPLIATYITSTEFYAALGDRKRPSYVTAVYSNPDPIDQVALAESLLGSASLGVFDSPAAQSLVSRVKTRSVQSIPAPAERGIDSLLQAANGVNAIIVLPDPAVINRTNISHVVRALYERRAVLIGYSQTLTRAGSLASIYISPDAMTAEIIGVSSGLASGAVVPSPIFVRDVSVAVNEQLARSLNIAVPPTVELMNSLRARRKESSQ